STSAARLYSERAEKLVSRGEISSASVVSFERLGLMRRGERGKPIRVLSLGQLRRLDLALALLSQPDVLLLDEPTNHLSITLVEELTEAFSSMRCALLVSSHDRGMLRDLEEWPTLPLPVAV
ncbi:MAG: ATP-binding cassette domain-containing protein, partial [Mycobacterium sp.]